MDDPFPTPRVSLLVQSVDDAAGEPVTLEDLRTGRRQRFDSLQALAAWLAMPARAGVPAAADDGPG